MTQCTPELIEGTRCVFVSVYVIDFCMHVYSHMRTYVIVYYRYHCMYVCDGCSLCNLAVS